MKVEIVEDVTGTSLQTYLNTSFARLVELFGYPDNQFGDDKVRVEWCLLVSGKYPVTIYDWKESTPVEDLFTWNVGGNNWLTCMEVKEWIERQ